MASCGSSTHEGASDVSLFHACLNPPPFALAGFVLCCCVVGVVFVCFLVFASARAVSFPHGSEINSAVCEVVCEDEGPSELSWRARHGRKKKQVQGWFPCLFFASSR